MRKLVDPTGKRERKLKLLRAEDGDTGELARPRASSDEDGLHNDADGEDGSLSLSVADGSIPRPEPVQPIVQCPQCQTHLRVPKGGGDL